ncbi:MAG: metallophosphoesterase [Lachnospiraceae bacterium]|nr:metallophosphoesterase [Lachnospiraceae bacterium]
MKVLLLADEEVAKFYEFYRPGMLSGYDLILACGDLHREYLEFLVTMSGKPLYYVRGNHDDAFDEDPPGGCTCIEDKLTVINGIRFLGLGGSMRYRSDGTNMYTERAMRKRIRKLWFPLWLHKGFDVLVAHAPAYGMGDMEDLPHKGFQCFVDLIDRYNPLFMVYGHIHGNYGIRKNKVIEYKDTLVVNAWQYAEIEIPDRKEPIRRFNLFGLIK